MINPGRTFVGLSLVGLLICGACATAPRAGAEAPPERIKDSRPERVAATRAGAPASLELEQNDERWGIEAARERREAQKDSKARAAPAPARAPTTATVAPAPNGNPAPEH